MVEKIKKKFPKAPDMKHLITHRKEYGNNGFFMLPNPKKTSDKLFILIKASNGMGWEHVSASIPTESRSPTWEEMCYIKDMFWDDSDVVVQFHPARKDYVNLAKYCLHLWRPTYPNNPILTPPSIMVGINSK